MKCFGCGKEIVGEALEMRLLNHSGVVVFQCGPDCSKAVGENSREMMKEDWVDATEFVPADTE
jgi:hypothetical protein